MRRPPGHLITGVGREEMIRKGGGEELVAASKQFRRSRGEKSTRLGLVALTVGLGPMPGRCYWLGDAEEQAPATPLVDASPGSPPDDAKSTRHSRKLITRISTPCTLRLEILCMFHQDQKQTVGQCVKSSSLAPTTSRHDNNRLVLPRLYDVMSVQSRL